MYKLRFVFTFFLISFQSFCSDDVCRHFGQIFDEAAKNVNERNRIELINTDLRIDKGEAVIKMSFSRGFLYLNYYVFKSVKSIELRSRNVSFCVSCNELRYVPERGVVELSGNVLFTINERGEELRTSSIFIDLGRRRAFSDAAFDGSIKGGSKIFGSGFTVDLDNGEYEIKKMRSKINKGFNFLH